MKQTVKDWYGEFPETWDAIKFRLGFSFSKGLNITKEDLVDEGIPVISYGQVHSKDNSGTGIVDTLLRYVPDTYLMRNRACLVHNGDFIFADTSEDYAGIGNAAFVDCETTLFAGYHSIIARPFLNTIYPKYYAYLFLTDCWRDQIRANVMGVKVFSVTNKLLRNTFILLPPIEEQERIADYLDSECAKLDAIITTVQQQIETLKAYKKSFITEVVTKGLDSTVEMKDSGVDWIGKIPKHWDALRLKYVMDNYDYLRKPIEASERSQDGDVLYDYYGASGIIDQINDYIVEGEKLLIGEDGANLVYRNLPLIYIADGKYWVNNHAHILHPKDNWNLHYFAHQMEIIDYTVFITGSAQPKLNQENLNNVMLVVPPADEQDAIADYLDEKCHVIDSIMQEKSRQLSTVKQHKNSLIYEYVTGKKRVKEVI